MDIDVSPSNPVVQTFQPGTAGTLDRVSLMLYKMCSTCDGRWVSIEIWQGLPSGARTKIATSAPITITGAFQEEKWYDFDLPERPVVTANTYYSIYVTGGGPSSGNNSGVSYKWANVYARGSVWVFAPHNMWEEFTGADDSELTFKTWMTPNSNPTLATNTGLTVSEGQSGTIAQANLRATDAEESAATGLTFKVGTAPANGSLQKSGVAMSTNSTFTQDDINNNRITYVHNGSETTSDSFAFTVADTMGGTTGSTTFTLTVTPVNDPPVLSGVPAPVSVNEDTNTTITGISVADPDLGSNPLTVTLSASHGTLTLGSTAGLTINSGGNGTAAISFTASVSNVNTALGSFTYRGAADYNGADTISLSVADQAGSVSGAIGATVVAVNDAPSFTKGADQTVAEDAGAQTVANWATGSAGPANESAQTLTYTVTNTNNGLFSVQPAINAAGTLSYTPAANASGSATVTVTLSDGIASTAAQTFTISVSPVNDAPSFTKGANQSVGEDAGAQSIANWAASISAGPADEAAQTLTFTVTNDNNGLFSVQPALSNAGTLTYTPAANENGSATVTVTLSDNGGGTNTSTQTFTITVVSVNDAPGFTKGADQTVAEDSGPQSVAGWATGLSPGPAQESAQTLSFNVTNNNAGLFSAQPAISSSGDLSYTPAANANGSATVTVTVSDNGGTANGGVDTSAAQTFTIAVTAVNDAPVFTKGADQVVPENSGAQSVANWATGISAGAANESAQTLTFTVTNDNNGLFSVQPAISSAGTLTYTPASNTNGSATVTVTLSDDGGGADTSAAQTFTITVAAVNDAPSFAKGADQSVDEDAGAQSIAGWATGISPGPVDEAAQTVTFTVTNDNNSLFSAQPAVSPTGTLTYTPAANANGTATVTVTLKDNGGTLVGGVDTSAAQTFTITVAAVNDVPTFTQGADQSIAEDAGAKSIANWATGISAGPADESAQTLTFTVTNDNNGLFSAQPAISSSGTLTYTPAADANGSATVSVTLSDGVDPAATQTFTITVTPVNDTPVFTKGADQSVAEDAGAQTVANWATGISAGPANESGQTLTFTVANDNNGLFSAQPAISSGGSLTYTPAANANGSATVTVMLSDNGGGADTSAAQTFTITVTAVNDTPSFTKGPDQTVAEDAGAQSVAAWATAISAGPADESGQPLTFTVSTDNSALFSVQPAISSGGALTYTPAANASGSATVTVTLSDNGGGADTSAAQAFTVTVTAVNDLPVFTKGADQSVAEDAGAQSSANWATGISAGPADEAAQPLTFTVSNDNSALFAVQPAISSGGTLTFTPAADANGSATVTVMLSDGVDSAAAQTFTITVTAVNDLPVFTKGADQSVTEDAGAQSVANWAAGISAGPANEAAQTLSFTVSTNNSGLFSAQPAISSGGLLTYTPAADANGSATVTVTLSDGIDASAAQTFTITVAAVNDVPSFTKGADQTVAEDASAQSVVNWATGISAGPANEAAQTLTFTVTNSNTGLFSAQPAISSSGLLTFTPAADANGAATVTVTLSDGIDASAAQTFTITVTAVNDTPSFTKGANQAVLEDAGAQSVANWATAISKGPANESGQTLTFLVSTDNNALFSTVPAISSSGLLTYTPAADANGVANVTVQVKDDGGGLDTTAAQTFTITVTAVNDAPSFTAGAGQTVPEDAGAQSVPNWATAISKGPADESGQTLAFTVTTDNSALFAVQPAISSGGALTYTPAANANGTATVTVTLSDNGGGADTSAAQTFTVTVTAVNDLPVFTKGADQSVAEDAGAQSSANWATGISAGPANEAAQTLTFTVSTTNNALFSVQPAISSGGLLSYTPAANANGSATVTVTLSDGVDTTAAQTFTITVTAVNDAPVFTGATENTVQTAAENTGLLSLAATDVEGDTPVFSITGGTLPAGIALNPDGTFTGVASYQAAGTYQLDLSVSDGQDSTAGHLTITITESDTTPTLAAIPSQTSNEGERPHLTVTGADVDGDRLTYSAIGLPAGLTIDPATGEITGSLSYSTFGTYQVTVTVRDATATAGNGAADQASRSFVWTVNDVNVTPQFMGPSSIRVAEGEALPGLSATDVDNDAITFAAGGGALPEGVQLESGGSFSGTASYRSAATYSLTVALRDARGGTSTGQVTIVVTNTDTTPALDAVADQTSTAGNQVSLALTAKDIDGDTLTFRAQGLPPGLAIDGATGTISGTIDPKGAKLYRVEVSVTDNTPGGAADSATQSFAWQVNAKRGPKPISGRAANAKTGAPVSGATVQVTDATGAVAATVTTGADGSFATAEVPEGTYSVAVSARGYTGGQASVTIGPDEPQALSITLAPLPATISGIITDGGNGKGIAGVAVTLTQDQLTLTTTTGQGGRFSFLDVPGGEPVTVAVTDADYLDAVPAVIPTEPGAALTQNFTLQPRVRLTLSGPPESEKLQLPPGVSGSYLAGRPVAIAVNGRTVATVTADGAGAFTYDLSAIRADLLFGINSVTAQAQTPAGRSLTSNTVRFNYSPAGSVAGTVSSETGAPLGGMALHLQSALGKAGQSTTTAADGTFEFAQVPAGVYNLVAGPPERPLANVHVAVTGGQRTERTITINTRASLTLTASPAALVGDGRSTSRLEAQVTLSSGQPAAGITVQFTASAGTLSSASAVTDSNGRASVTLTAPALTRATLRQEEVRAAVSDSASAVSAESSRTISFVPATITGVVMENGQPVEGARVSVAEDFNADGIIDFTATVLTGPDGKYVIEVPRGNWAYKANVELPAKAGALPLKTTQTSNVGALGQVGENVNATQAIGGQITIRQARNAPVKLPPGATVQADLRDQGGNLLQGVQVAADGSYLVEGVAAGEYEIVVQVTAPDGQKLAGAMAKASVSEGGALVISSILIDPYGIVTDALTGAPIEGVKMRLMWADTPLNRTKNRTPHTEVQLPLLENFPPAGNADPQWTDSQGNYAWMVFPDGDYYLLGEKEGYLPYDSRKEGRHVPAAAGEDSFIEKGVIHVGQAIVHYDFSMQPLRGVHKAYVNGFPDGEFKPDRTLTRAEAATILARLLAPAGFTGSADPFRDVPATHWASKSIAATAALGLMKGDPDGRFRPDDTLTRAEIAVIIGRIKRLPALTGNAFPDTLGHWAEGAIKAAQTAGLMRGLPDGTFAPGRGVTRAEFVTVMNRALGRGPAPAGEPQIFPDVTLTHWATGQITEAAREHAFEMQPDGTEAYIQP